MKKVLIVSFLFPPLNDIGALRVGKFAKYLPDFGWEPLVLTAEAIQSYPRTHPVETDEANVFRVPYFALGAFVKRKFALTASGSLANAKGSLRGQTSRSLVRLITPLYELPGVQTALFSPAFWCGPAIQKAVEVSGKHKVNVIFSSFSPWVSHFVASRLQEKTKIPWIAEFRDLWTSNPYQTKPRLYTFFEKRLERRVMKNAHSLITVSPPSASVLERLHSKPVAVIPNGFDEDDYSDVDIPLSSRFTITYTGEIYPHKRDPSRLFEAVRQLYREGEITPANFEIRFFGRAFSLRILQQLIEEYSLGELVKTYELIPYREVIKKQKESSALLLLEWDNPLAAGSYTGKVFEYLGAGRPVLALAFRGGVIDNLLRETGSGVVTNEAGEIKGILKKWLLEFRQTRDITSYFNPNLETIMQYTRRRQASKLAEILKEAATGKEQ